MALQTLSSLLRTLIDDIKTPEITIALLRRHFDERGFGFFLFLFALPAALPLPGLGINTIIALPLLIIATQMATGRQTVWLPAFIDNKNFEKERLDKLINKALP